MKLGKLKGDKVTSTLGQTVGVIGGAMASKGVAGILPIQNKTIAKGVIALAGVAIATMVDGSDTAAKAVRSIGLGMAVQQGNEIISDAVKPALPAPTNKVTQFLHDAVGGGSAPSAMAKALGRKMGNPEFNFRMANPTALPSATGVEFAMV